MTAAPVTTNTPAYRAEWLAEQHDGYAAASRKLAEEILASDAPEADRDRATAALRAEAERHDERARFYRAAPAAALGL